MKNNPLIAHLATLSRKEMTRFAEFAASPYFNKHKLVKALAELLSEIYPDFSIKKCDRRVIFQKLCPGEDHNQAQLAIVFSYTMRLLEQFLVVEALADQGRLEDKTLYYSQLRKKNLNQYLKTGWETTDQKRLTENLELGSKSALFYQDKIRIAAEKDAIGLCIGNNETTFLEEKQAYLDAYYFTETLRDACERCQRYRLLKSHAPANLHFEYLVKFLSENPKILNQTAEVEVYFQLYNLLNNNDTMLFKPCKETIQHHERLFDSEELQNLYNYLQNFCIQQINNGHHEFLQEVFLLYQLQLDRKLLLVNGVLPEWHYKNIVTTGLRLDEREWVRTFIDDYSTSLEDSVAENAYSYNLAVWYYHVGKPTEVLPLLLQVEYTDIRYNLDAKSLLLRTYFDLEEEEALLAHAEAFKQFVKRNKSLTDFQKRGYLNLIQFAKRAFRLKMQQSFAKQKTWLDGLQALEMEINEAEPVFNRFWLEGKVAALKGRAV